MTSFVLMIYTLKFFIPSFFTFLFRAFGLGYTTRRKLIAGFFVFLLYMAIVPSALITVMGYGNYTHIVSLVMTLGSMSALIFSSDSPKITILLILITAQMNTVISVPLNMIRHLFGLSYLTLDIMLLFVCSMIYLIALRFWVKPLRFIADNMHGRLTTAILLPIVTTGIIYAIPVYPVRNFEFHPIFCTLLMLLTELVFFLYIMTLYNSVNETSVLSRQKTDMELLQLSTKEMEERIQLMDHVEHQSRIMLHDHRHFNHMISRLLEHEQIEEAKAILQKQSEHVFLKDRKYCENTTINASISHFTSIAKSHGIEPDIQLEIPNELPIDSLELAITISNLFENAIHGCDELTNSKEKFIFATCRFVGRLVLEISNSCHPDVNLDKEGLPFSQQKGHGLGTKSVRAFVAKYDAELLYHIENETFHVRIIV